jgi:hypothetical protein
MDLARSCTVAYFSVGQAREIDADVGFGNEADTEADSDESLDEPLLTSWRSLAQEYA